MSDSSQPQLKIDRELFGFTHETLYTQGPVLCTAVPLPYNPGADARSFRVYGPGGEDFGTLAGGPGQPGQVGTYFVPT